MNTVSLVCKSEPCIPEATTLKELVVFCARVSNPKNQDNTDTAEKLFNYLMREKHWSPFEMVSLTMEINTTRDIARQILRHRSFSFQEFSQRYADPITEKLGFDLREARLQDQKNRQNSIAVKDQDLQNAWDRRQDSVITAAETAYQWALQNGIAKEQARAVLPEGNTRSRMYMAGTLRSWLHYIDVREGNGTQAEHIEIAKQVKAIITDLLM
jgi:thymidylate synthase (FAD)